MTTSSHLCSKRRTSSPCLRRTASGRTLSLKAIAERDHGGLYVFERDKQQYIVCKLWPRLRIRTLLEVSCLYNY